MNDNKPIQNQDHTTPPSPTNTQSITLGGGCFWCLDAVYQNIKGIEQIRCGYAGGHAHTATYPQVCSGNTNHAEVVELVYNPQVISLNNILDIFFSIHDATQLNRQGHDVGTQYRSVIFYTNPNDVQAIQQKIEQIKQLGLNVVTQVQPAPQFFEAEPEHQNYFYHHPNQGYCQVVIAPKIIKSQNNFSHLHK